MKSKLKMVIPLALVLGVGMATAQTRVGESIKGKEKIPVKTVTVDDGTLYPQAPRVGASASFDQGDVTYEVCQGAVCADSASFFTSTYYYWERYDINDTTWKNYAAYSTDTIFVPGEYRLIARYIRSKWTVSARASISERNLAREKRDADFAQHSVQEVRVNGIEFERLSCDAYNLTVRSPRWRCYYVSPTVTVGKSKPIVFKPICSDGTNKCSAEYSGPAKSFIGDSVKFSVKNTNQDYGWGVPLQCKDKDAMCYLGALLSAYLVPINPSSSNIDSLYESVYFATLSLNSDDQIDKAFNGSLPYAYWDTTDHADTIYYPLTLRDVDINYEKTDHGTVSGPAKAHDGEILFFKIVPEDGYDLDSIWSRGMDENNVMMYNLVPPEVSELMPDGSRFALFMAQDGFDQNIGAEFKKVGQEITMVKTDNGTYSVTSRGKEHSVDEKMFLTNAAGSTISVKPTPAAGYAVRSVTCSYITKDDGEVTNNLALGTDSLYSCAIPDTSVLSEDILDRTKQIKINVAFAKESKIDIDVTGRGMVVAYIMGSVDTAGNYTKGYCSSKPTETEGNACTALDGDTILIEVEDSEGHPLQQLSCKNGTTANCKDSKKFAMKAVDAQIVAIFDALNYALTKTGDHADDFDLYIGWDSNTPATQAHEFDTVYVKSKDGKHVVVPGNNGTDLYVTDPKTGVDVIYFIMPASDKEVHVDDDAYYSTVNLARKIVGKGTAIINIGSTVRTLEEGELIRVVKGNDFFSFVRSTPAEGYTFDSTKCYYGDSYSDSTAIPLLQGGMHAGAFPVEKEEDITCEIFFNPKTYKIAWTQADTNGFVQGVPEKGNTDESISFKVSPVADYEIDFVKAYYTEKDSSNKDVSVLLKLSNTYDQKKNTYTYKFSMPAHDVNVEVAFKEIKSSSSSAKSSSSKAKSSSSSAKAKSSSSSAKAKSSSSSAKAKSSSSSAKAKSSSSKKKTALPVMAQVPQFSLLVNGRTMQIAGARVGSKMEVFDLQGHRVLTGSVDAANFSVAMPRSGSYLVRIDGQTQNVNIK